MIDVFTVRGSAFASVVNIMADLKKFVPHRLRVLETERDLKHLDMADRVLLLGGADINPVLYGQRRMNGTGYPVHARDALEFPLAHHALKHQIPVMGICRGHQMLAAAGGGTLYQDIEEDMGINHYPSSHALIGITEPLASILPTARVNSYHHQAVQDLPQGFDVAAWSHDGIIEAMYKPDAALGVQFHPEMLYTPSNGWSSLFLWWLRDELKDPFNPVGKTAPQHLYWR